MILWANVDNLEKLDVKASHKDTIWCMRFWYGFTLAKHGTFYQKERIQIVHLIVLRVVLELRPTRSMVNLLALVDL